MGSHITTNTKSIKTFQFNLKSKVIAAILNCKMKTFTILSFIFLIVAIAFVAKAAGKRRVVVSGEMHLGPCELKRVEIRECLEEFGNGSWNGNAEVVACCKEQDVPEECIKDCEEKQP